MVCCSFQSVVLINAVQVNMVVFTPSVPFFCCTVLQILLCLTLYFTVQLKHVCIAHQPFFRFYNSTVPESGVLGEMVIAWWELAETLMYV